MLDFSRLKRVHFIGIGGVSLSSLALFLLSNGVYVTGSDRSYSEKADFLAEKGCEIWIGTCPEKIKNPDLTVFTSAISDNNEELVYCKNNGITCMERYVFLGEISATFDYTVAVAGTHGKTTVTSMLATIFKEANAPFYAHIGGDTVDFGNFYYTGNRFFITEACEYRKSLLALSPDIGIILNAEADHPDTYKNLSELYDTFDTFLDNSRFHRADCPRSKRGFALACGDTDYYKLRQSHEETVTFGINPENRFSAAKICEHKKGFYGFYACEYGQPICHIRLSVPGYHNVLNGLAAFAAAYLSRIDVDVIVKALESFAGVKRRFEKTSLFMGATVYSDYAHHPAEILAALKTGKSILKENKRLIAVFQPHTYSRTAQLYKQFVKCFKDCDYLIVCKEYPARETPDKGMDALTLYKGIDKEEKTYCGNIVDAAAVLMQKISPDDIVLVIGAGDIVNLCSLLSTTQ